MPFDRNSDANLIALKTEVETDPAGVGYQPIENINELLNKLNNPNLNPGAETSSARDFTGFDLLEACAVDPAEFTLVNNNLLREMFVSQLFDLKDSVIPMRFKNELLSIFTTGAAPNIRSAIIDLATGKLSRAEVIFGEDTIIDRLDWSAARNK